MNTRNCIIKNTGRCEEWKNGALTDRTGASFPVFCDFDHSNSIYNSVPVWLFDKSINTSKVIIFTTETEEEQDGIISAYETNSLPKQRFTRAYFAY